VSDASLPDVLAFAQLLRDKASHAQANDPWAKPYSPTDTAARKLFHRVGAKAAMSELATRALLAENSYRAQEEEALRARERHVAALRNADKETRKRREQMSYGRRIDDALAKLSMVSATPASVLESDHVSTNIKSEGLVPDDPMPRALTTARLAAEAIESELDAARRIRLTPVEPDRDARLLHLARIEKLTPEQISIFDPSQGSATRIRRRLAELGV
jgi:hypothetical protein